MARSCHETRALTYLITARLGRPRPAATDLQTLAILEEHRVSDPAVAAEEDVLCSGCDDRERHRSARRVHGLAVVWRWSDPGVAQWQPSSTVPNANDEGSGMVTFAVPFPASEVLNGANTITFADPGLAERVRGDHRQH